jgi:predicted DsbA family dithiol-disulfide isomerase
MQVEIWSDVVCPWCYIGKRRLETALARFDGRDDVEVVWRSFQLNPDQPRGERVSHDEHLRSKLGGTLEQVRELNAGVVALAAAEGLAYDFERYQVINTFDAHRVAHLGRAVGAGDAIQERLLRGQLVEGEVLDDPDTLVRLGAEAGLDGEAVREVLDTDRFAAEVVADLREARELGINGVPFFVIDRRYGVSGAETPDVLLRALQTAAADREVAAVDRETAAGR